MNTKNLPLCFGVLVVAVLIAVWSIFWGGGVRLGLDLRGGYKLVYEIRAKDTDSADLSQRAISVLKRRIDPLGTSSIEWRPLGKHRFEVRMPAGKEESRLARKAYTDALAALAAGNIQRSKIFKLLAMPASQRPAEIDRLAGDNKDVAGKLGAVVEAHDAVGSAKAAVKAARTDAEKKTANEALQNALSLEEERIAELLATNVKLRRLKVVLGNYVSPAEEKSMKQSSPRELTRRHRAFEEGLATLKKNHAARAVEMDRIVELYRKWSNVRRFLEDPTDLKRLIAKTGVLEFRIAPTVGGDSGLKDEEIKDHRARLAEEGAEPGRKRKDPYQWFKIRGERKDFGHLLTGIDPAGEYYVLLAGNRPNDVMLRGDWRLDDAYPTTDSKTMTPAVGFKFDVRGATRFANLTSSHLQQPMAVLLDDEVYSAPTIQSTISDSGIITGRFSNQEVNELVRTLDAGSLPARINPEPVSESRFDASIGRVNAELGKNAAKWGLITVVVFMLIYYLRAGFVADIALVLNLVLVVGAMSLMEAFLTLPGIAGLILTIGIAVDANVLIFERLREEQEKGQAVRQALKNAYQRAFSAIFDANITTLITCLILGWIGTEEVRGFAVTLGLGICFSLFTALVVTRWIFQAACDLRLMKKPLRLLHIIGVPKINWMSKRHFFWALSVAMMVLGIGSLVWQGKDILGIELAAGTEARLKFKDDVLIDGKLLSDGLVREGFIDSAGNLAAEYDQKADQAQGDEQARLRSIARGFDKLKATARVERVLDDDRVENFLRDRDGNGDREIAASEWKDQELSEAFFAVIDTDGNRRVTAAELDAGLPERTYQVSTTETRVKIIREAAQAAFGKALEARNRCEFDVVTDTSPALRVDLDGSGMTRITLGLANSAAGEYRGMLLDYLDGALIVVKFKGDTAPITPAEATDRVRRTRSGPDFAGLQLNSTGVIGLTPAGRNTFSSLAFLVRPADPEAVQSRSDWDGFAAGEMELLTAALHREDAIIATNYDAQIAGEAQALAIVAILLSCIAIVVYLWLRFGSIQWGLAAVICLVHDVTIVIGLVAVSGWLHDTVVGKALGIASFKLDLPMIAAFLTVIGYSVNDTIVVFDRIRENRGKLKTVSPLVINNSINQTLSRTLLTSGTTFIVVFIMYVWGGPGIHAFNYALLAGIIFGTYSSVAVASPLLLGFKGALVARTTGIEATAE